MPSRYNSSHFCEAAQRPLGEQASHFFPLVHDNLRVNAHRHGPDRNQRPSARQRVANECVPPVVDRQPAEAVQAEHAAGAERTAG